MIRLTPSGTVLALAAALFLAIRFGVRLRRSTAARATLARMREAKRA